MNITIIRNTAQTLTWTKSSDYSGDTVEFTVKADNGLTSSRVVDKTASVSYADGISTITVALTPSDSASLSADIYYYDLRVENDSTDRELLVSGFAYLDKSVRNDTDGSVVTESISIGSDVVEAIQDAIGVPLVVNAYNVVGTPALDLSAPQGMSVAFDSGILTFTHTLGATNAILKPLNDIYTYAITAENATALSVSIKDSEGALISAMDSNVNLLVNFNVSV